ncbi:hypothetical protein [Couchioplanes caeruleus]|nr:hypothetical protein [Couchioplanes caeruleus]
MVLVLECRSHLNLGDLPNLLAAELGVMTVRLERAIRSLDGVARVGVEWSGDGSAHLHVRFLARPQGRLQLRGGFLSLWNDILPVVPEERWREDLALVAAWLADFGGRAIAEPPHIHWQSPATFSESVNASPLEGPEAEPTADSADDIARGLRRVAGDEAVVGTESEPGRNDGCAAGDEAVVGAEVSLARNEGCAVGEEADVETESKDGRNDGRAEDDELAVGTDDEGGRAEDEEEAAQTTGKGSESVDRAGDGEASVRATGAMVVNDRRP